MLKVLRRQTNIPTLSDLHNKTLVTQQCGGAKGVEGENGGEEEGRKRIGEE